ncbi:MAG: type II secretion system F family protein [Phycisphaerales bacterium]|nr:MAG: type II secretion system F family protein [Phycisphaerales bacterium]
MPKALALAYDNLSTMLDAGVPLLRSLNTVASGQKPRIKEAFLALADGVSQGNPLAETMGRNRRVFSPLDVMLIGAGETSGNLAELTGLLGKWHEMSRRMLRKMLSGMLLPVLILTIAAFVVPVPGFILGDQTIGAYLLSVVCILLLFWIPATIIFLIVYATPKTGPLRRLLDRVVLRIPVLGRAMYRVALSRFLWVFHALCKAGVPLGECVGMAIPAAGNAVVGDMFQEAARRVRVGEPLGEGLSPRLPRELVEMWKVGEETGTLDEVTKRLADQNTDAAEFWLGEFARWFPRFVYFLVCLLLIYFVFVGYSRIYSI